MTWSNSTPSAPGFYWCYQHGRTRMVSVGQYAIDNANVLFTNEDGGAPVGDRELYGTAKWLGPVTPPEPPSNTR
jgi:hypothetical protein